jgi:phage FluMu protein Com
MSENNYIFSLRFLFPQAVMSLRCATCATRLSSCDDCGYVENTNPSCRQVCAAYVIIKEGFSRRKAIGTPSNKALCVKDRYLCRHYLYDREKVATVLERVLSRRVLFGPCDHNDLDASLASAICIIHN